MAVNTVWMFITQCANCPEQYIGEAIGDSYRGTCRKRLCDKVG